jgi:hypothetical protein
MTRTHLEMKKLQFATKDAMLQSSEVLAICRNALLWSCEPAPGIRRDAPAPTLGMEPGIAGVSVSEWDELRIFTATQWLHARPTAKGFDVRLWSEASQGLAANCTKMDIMVRKDSKRFGIVLPEIPSLKLHEYRDQGRAITWRLSLPDNAGAQQP